MLEGSWTKQAKQTCNLCLSGFLKEWSPAVAPHQPKAPEPWSIDQNTSNHSRAWLQRAWVEATAINCYQQEKNQPAMWRTSLLPFCHALQNQTLVFAAELVKPRAKRDMQSGRWCELFKLQPINEATIYKMTQNSLSWQMSSGWRWQECFGFFSFLIPSRQDISQCKYSASAVGNVCADCQLLDH